MNRSEHHSPSTDEAEEDGRTLRAQQADDAADRRDLDAQTAADTAEERDRRAALRDEEAARRQAALLVSQVHGDQPDSEDAAAGETRTAAEEQAEIDREMRHSVIHQLAPRLLDDLAELEGRNARWQQVRAEYEALRGDRAEAANDRQLAAEERAAALHARNTGAEDRAEGAADRDQRQIDQAKRP